MRLQNAGERIFSGFSYDANGNRATSSQSPGPSAGITSRSRSYTIATGTNRLASYSQTDVVAGIPVNSRVATATAARACWPSEVLSA